MIRVVIIDDEENGIGILTELLQNFLLLDIEISGIAYNLEDGLVLIEQIQPDIVFLDINMPGKKGLAIYDYYNDPQFKIIFTTAYSEYSLQALKKNAFDYLLKPICINELRQCMQTVTMEINTARKRESSDKMKNYIKIADNHGKDIIITNEHGFIIVNTKNIAYCSAEHPYSYVFTNDNKKILVTKTLIDFEKLLPQNQFYRTHKSYIINISYLIRFVRAEESYVELEIGVQIPVSFRKSSVILKEINQLIEKNN